MNSSAKPSESAEWYYRSEYRTIRAWLGHVSLDTTNIYAETDLETKARALAKCEVTDVNKSKRHRRDDPALRRSCRLVSPNSYVAFTGTRPLDTVGFHSWTLHKFRGHITHTALA
jgi:hypothetical protein